MGKNHKKSVGINGFGGLQATVTIGTQQIPQSTIDELASSYTQFQSYFPLLEKFVGDGKINSDIVMTENTGLKANLPFPPTDEVYVKVIHLLKPDDWIQGNYTFTKDVAIPGLAAGWENVVDKLQLDENQAYVDTLTVSILSQLREKGLSPHFTKYYGALVAKANKYCYNISEEFDSYKATKWFWTGAAKNQFGLRIYSNEKQRFLNQDEMSNFMLTPEQVELLKDEEDDSVGHVTEMLSETSFDDVASIHSVHFDFSDSRAMIPILKISPSNRTLGSDTDEEEDNDIFVELHDMPVILVFMEKLDGVMDSLLDTEETLNREACWTAWICQIIFALTQAQAFIELYHNDLHGNNILYSNTTEQYLYYSTKDGQIWRLPTFGKIFYLIDFGRAILKVQNQLIISDDFYEDNDAHGQYNFGSIRNQKEPLILPNPSFDLVRLTVSIFESLFPKIPDTKPSGSELSREGNKIQRETISPLFNLMWSWLIDNKGKNILYTENGEERFPGFDLYKHISSSCKGAIPREQIRKPIFEKFKLSQHPNGVPIYPLFV